MLFWVWLDYNLLLHFWSSGKWPEWNNQNLWLWWKAGNRRPNYQKEIIMESSRDFQVSLLSIMSSFIFQLFTLIILYRFSVLKWLPSIFLCNSLLNAHFIFCLEMSRWAWGRECKVRWGWNEDLNLLVPLEDKTLNLTSKIKNEWGHPYWLFYLSSTDSLCWASFLFVY